MRKDALSVRIGRPGNVAHVMTGGWCTGNAARCRAPGVVVATALTATTATTTARATEGVRGLVPLMQQRWVNRRPQGIRTGGRPMAAATARTCDRTRVAVRVAATSTEVAAATPEVAPTGRPAGRWRCTVALMTLVEKGMPTVK
jgi:hypothetical protein